MKTQISITNKIRHRGFTLVELMLVIMILSLIAGASGVYYVGTYRKTSLKAAAREMLLMGKYARIYAIENRQVCRMYLDRQQEQMFLVALADNDAAEGNQETMISNPYCRKKTLKSGVEFEDVQIQPLADEGNDPLTQDSCINFYPDGSCDGAVVQIGNGRHSMTTIFLSAYAKVKVFEGSADQITCRMQAIDLDAED